MMAEVSKGRNKEKVSQNNSIIIFVGPEGSGKSTIGKMLSQRLQRPYISTGDTIRDRAENDKGPVGDACRKMIKEHAYLDPKLLMQLLSDRLSKEDVAKGAVIDGGLRTLYETKHFDEVLVRAKKQNSRVIVIYLDIPDEMGIERILGKRDLRPGETRETILIRQGHFYTGLDERMKIARERYNFSKIDASKSIDEVFESVLSLL